MTDCPLPDGDHTDDAWWSKHDERIRELETAAVAWEEACEAWKARAEKAEARVAELERMEEHWHNRALLLARGEPLAAIERGEREAD